MADPWGTSWGGSWGNSWDAEEPTQGGYRSLFGFWFGGFSAPGDGYVINPLQGPFGIKRFLG